MKVVQKISEMLISISKWHKDSYLILCFAIWQSQYSLIFSGKDVVWNIFEWSPARNEVGRRPKAVGQPKFQAAYIGTNWKQSRAE